MDTIKILEAAARRECGICGGTGSQDFGDYVENCGACYSTGLWLPMLSRPCINCEPEGGILPKSCPVDWEPGCGGTGRMLLLDDPIRLIEAARQLSIVGGYWDLTVDDANYRWHMWVEGGQTYEVGIDNTWIKAMQAALAAVIQSVWPED